MKSKRLIGGLLAAAILLAAPAAQAAYTSLFVFGDSLSDSGNNALLTGTSPLQVLPDNAYFSTLPYASGTYSNGWVWTQRFAVALGLSATPSLLGGGNYAFGGAQTALDGVDGPGGFPFSLKRQTEFFLAGHGNVAPSDALYVLESGGNNARAALDAILQGADPASTIAAAAQQYALDTGLLVDRLQAAGASHIVVWNTPDVGLTPLMGSYGPAAMQLASALSMGMNAALAERLSIEQGLISFDVFGLLNQTAHNGALFGLSNVSDACGAAPNCNPAQYLFWDGIHPTTRGHELLADAMLAAVPEPASFALVMLGLLLMPGLRRRPRA